MEIATRYTVYETTNLLNGKIYIGKHKTLNPDDQYLGSGLALNRAINKYGKENFRKKVLFIFDSKEEMDAKEAELVSLKFCREENNYNLAPGGTGGFGYINDLGRQGYHLYPELAKANRAKADLTKHLWYKPRKTGSFKHSEESRVKMSLNRQEKCSKHSDETKAKMSASKKVTSAGERNSQFGSMWITNGISNKKIKAVDPIPDGWYRGRK